MTGSQQCTECGSYVLNMSTVPGLVSCGSCGFLQPAQPDLVDPAELCEECGGEGSTSTLTGVAVRCEICGGSGEEPEADEAMAESDESIEAPDQIELEYGWRAWGVKKNAPVGAVPVLQSVTHTEAFWTPRVPMGAICPLSTGRGNGVKRSGHEVPDEGCSCGLYSAKTYEHLMGMSYHRYDAERYGLFHVVGRVKLWGKVIEGSQGWRAAIGYPDQLWVPFEAWELVEPLAETYGVPVSLKNFLSDPLKRQTTKGRK